MRTRFGGVQTEGLKQPRQLQRAKKSHKKKPFQAPARRTFEKIDLDGVPVPKEIEEAWASLRASIASSAEQRAVYRAVVLRETWKEAAKQERVSERTVWKFARMAGLAGRTRTSAAEGYARLVTLGQETLEERLVTAPDALETRDVVAVTGMAGKQLQETWEQESGATGYMSVLDALAKRLREGGTLRLEVTGTPEAIDVTPRSPA